MNWYERIKQYYGWGFWTDEMVKNAVGKERITPEQYKEITGLDYQA